MGAVKTENVFLIETVRKMPMQFKVCKKSAYTHCVHAQARTGQDTQVWPLHGLAVNQFHPDSC